MPARIVFFDIETTGFRFGYDRIIEIAAIKVEKNKIVDSFCSLVNIGEYLPPEITRLTGITPDDLKKAPTFDEIKDKILSFLEDSVLAAHHVRFDYGFLKQEMRREGIEFTNRHFCTAQLSRYLYPKYKNHSLDHLIRRFNIQCQHRHRAYDDVLVLWQFYQRILKNFTSDEIQKAIHHVLQRRQITSSIDDEIIERLPKLPGVYLFWQRRDTSLYW